MASCSADNTTTGAIITKNDQQQEASSSSQQPATATAADTSTSTQPPQQQQLPPSLEELLELVRAIKFANPDLSQRAVHKEITESLADKAECLRHVKLQEVKKVWKKANSNTPAQQRSTSNEGSGAATTAADSSSAAGAAGTAAPTSAQPLHNNSSSTNNNNNNNSDLRDKLKGTTPEVFTVGDASSVYKLAQDYTAAHIAQQAAKEEAAQQELAQNYVHVFLDVPADKSGQRPHQALINFQHTNNSSSTSSSGGGGTTSNNKKNSKQQSSGSKKDKALSNGDEVIVKIQRAAPLGPADTTKHPMLLYNQSRTIKTFIHPDTDMEGYDKLQALIVGQGTGGALGQLGGTKAYFYGRFTKRNNKKQGGTNILSIQITELVSEKQEW